MVDIKDLLDLDKTIARDLFSGKTYPWEVLAPLNDFILALGATLPEAQYNHPVENIWIAKDAVVAASASLTGPLIIDSGAEVRQCAFIRGSVIVGKGAVVGNSTELKNALLFDGVQVPHYNYVGDSVLGYHAHFGAGSITSNVKGDKSLVEIRAGDQRLATGRKKVGAIVGDYGEIGCNAVLNPGTIVGRRAQVYPLCSVRGYVPSGSIYKGEGRCVPREERTR
ncbi:MAG: UDP-N-acetylglucosamine pyrophosphorylase [Christensenellales bacterium]